MLLAIDVGNTNMVIGVFDGDTLIQSWRLQTLRERTSDELGLLVEGLFKHSGLDQTKITGVVVGSVVPPLTGTTCTMVERFFKRTPLVVEPGSETPACRFATKIPPRSAPIASSTRSPRTNSSAPIRRVR